MKPQAGMEAVLDDCPVRLEYYVEKQLTSRREAYLKIIYILREKERFVRVRDIAAAMKKSMPSVCSALNRLKGQDMVVYNKHDYVELTPGGVKTGSFILTKYRCICSFLCQVLMMDPITAGDIACRIEHGVSHEMFFRMERVLVFHESCGFSCKEWIEDFNRSSEAKSSLGL
jgi:Mn-dependent DtxR family transcriptional regulator